MTNHPADLTTILQAIADPTRRAILQQLGYGPAPVSKLAQPFEMALPTFLAHLKVLERSGLIQSRKVGRVRICELDPEPLAEVQTWLSEQRDVWTRRLDQLDEYLLQLKEKEGSTYDDGTKSGTN